MPNIPDWITAIATLGALGAALWAGVSAARVYRIEAGRDRVGAAQRERLGASRVSAWTAIYFDRARRRSGAIVISNHDETPIFDVTIQSQDEKGQPQPALVLRVLPPGDYFAHEKERFSWSFPAPVAQAGDSLHPVTKHPEWRVTEFTFSDAAGRRWARNARGELRALAEPATFDAMQGADAS